MKRTLLFILVLLGCLASCQAAYAQSRTNRIFRACPSTVVKAVVEVRVEGDIYLIPCSGGDIEIGTFIVARANDRVSVTTPHFELSSVDRVTLNAGITNAGTTGDRTINTPAGTVNFAAGAGTAGITVTSNIVNTGSIIWATARTNDATCSVKNVVPANGSFVIRMTANCTAETSVGFLVVNQ